LYNYLYIFLTLICLSLSAQQPSRVAFHQLSVDEGLSQSSVVSIAQDSKGYLWFATQDGLNQYYGKGFIYHQLQFDDITSKSSTRLGKVYSTPTSTYAIVKGGKLLRLDSLTHRFQPVVGSPEMNSLFLDRKENFWLGTFNDGLYRVTPQKDTLQFWSYKEVPYAVNALVQHQDRVFVGTTGGLYMIDANLSFTKLPYEGSSELIVSSLVVDREGTLWVGTNNSGLFSGTPKDWQQYP